MKSRHNEFKSHEYDRPNQAWACGAEASGLPCPLGPTRHGACQAICTPFKMGDRFLCENACETAGSCDQGPLSDGGCCQTPPQCKPGKRAGVWQCTRGQCPDGPLPDGSCSRVFVGCKPERSVLEKRRLLVIGVIGLVIGGLLVVASLDRWQYFLSPGQLTAHHHTISECADCHTAASGNLGVWVDVAVTVRSRHHQNAGCQKCHAAELGPDSLFAHGLPISTLNALRQKESPSTNSHFGARVALMRLARGEVPAVDQTQDCATCHREHRGGDFDLKQLTDTQCQSCHMTTFHSFNDGHPDFSNFPYRTKAHLYFDHASHLNNHFNDDRYGGRNTKVWNCSDCHQPDLAGRSMQLKSYEATCAQCHDDQIRNSLNPGIAFFSLPAIDTGSLSGELAVGEWPESYPHHVHANGVVSPLTSILLSSQAGFLDQLRSIDQQDLSDLSGADPAQRQKVSSFVWALKQAWWQILSEGRSQFRTRVAEALGQDGVPDERVEQLYEQLQQAQRLWLPNLEDEVRRHQSGEQVESSVAADESSNEGDDTQQRGETGSRSLISAGWFRHDLDLSIRYRPSEHRDAWLRAWLDSVVSSERRDVGPQGPWPASVTQGAFEQLGSVASPGRCLKCHSAIDDLQGGLAIRWQPRDESSLAGRFTLFQHAPHLTGLAGQCQPCHEMKPQLAEPDAEQLFRESFVGRNWMPNTNRSGFVSDFSNLSKSTCTQCHSATKASNSCLTCHPYHVRPSDWP